MKLERAVNKQKFGILDIIIFFVIAAVIYMFMSPGIHNTVKTANVVVSTDLSKLPFYSLMSLGRMTAAYILSLAFSLVYGYTAAHNKKAEKIMIPVLDILQSIPVLSFLPAVVLGLTVIFPGRFGIELASIILIFTGQAWNMTFSFYNSVKLIPRDLIESSNIFKLNKWQKFKVLELPYSAIGLVWNSMMSWAGGWFFLMACEMFRLKGHDFRLPGIGSFLQTAANEGNMKALLWGIFTLILLIVLLDQLIFRPIIAWSDKFKVELTQSGDEPNSIVLMLIRRSVIIETISGSLSLLLNKVLRNKVINQIKNIEISIFKFINRILKSLKWIFIVLFAGTFIYFLFKTFVLLSGLSLKDAKQLLPSALYSILRVLAAQALALIWTVPVGVAIGMNKKLANILQPIIQIVASIPATALFPVILVFFINAWGGLGTVSILLMLMGTQWYILFNVIAGAMSIPEDLKATGSIFGLHGLKKWKTLIIPSVFPYLLTGMITATGGCWNASIVSEYVNYAGKTVKTTGLGSLIASTSESGNYALLLASTLLMCFIVAATNRLVWKRLNAFSEERFKLDI